MSRTDKPDLTTEERKQIVDLAREGIPLAVIALKFGVTKNALYMHKLRKSAFGVDMARAIEQACADYVIWALRRIRAMADAKNSCWPQGCWELQRAEDGFAFQTPGERAAVEVDIERAKQLRDSAKNPHEGSAPDPRFA
jgi:hypothetical protein